MHNTRLWRRLPAQMAKSAKPFVMNSTTLAIFPAPKFRGLTGGLGSGVAISTTIWVAYSKKPKVRKTALFCIESFTVTIRLASRLAIPFSMHPENWSDARAQRAVVPLHRRNRARKLSDNFSQLRANEKLHRCY